ncbi:TniQ family protein [Nocardia sp. NPDC058499]|uniref:TniQ family protein n=1 Tax=Nocardia sp. NPDC058499 TaxID=3346530 RepID=UPI00365F9A78
MSTRTLPIRVPPLPGEAIDSWLEALAARHRTSWADLLDALGFTQPRSAISSWIARLDPGEITSLVAATGIEPAVATAMTLDCFHTTALRIDSGTRTLDKTFPWSPSAYSRFCPHCLAETRGRWQLSWRLSWSFACLTHQRLLADLCGACGQRQRPRPLAGTAVPTPGRCGCPRPGSVGVAPQRCGADLTGIDTLRLAADHPALTAQRTLDHLIATGTTDFGVYAAAPCSAEAALADIGAVASRVLSVSTTEPLASAIPGDLLAGFSTVADIWPLPRKSGPDTAATTAVTTLAALAVLTAPDAHQGGKVLHRLVDRTPRRAKPSDVAPRSTVSPALEAVRLAFLAPSMRLSNQLRYRIADPHPRRPDPASPRADTLVRGLPTMLWPAWSLRLALPQPQQRRLRPALSAALLLTGTSVSTAHAGELLGGHISSYHLNRALALLAGTGHWESIRHALTLMADHLAAGEVPIDYQRRRHLDYTDLMPDRLWTRLCRDTGTPARKPATAALARCFLFERLSGLPADTGPGATGDSYFRNRAANFAQVLTPELAHALDSHAREFLSRHGIDDEPPSWEPPSSLFEGHWLPGPDPAEIGVDQLHQVIRQGPIGTAAERLGTTLDVVRYLLEIHPAPLTPEAAARSGKARGISYLTAKGALPPDKLTDLYLHRRMSITGIAEHVGVAGHVITDLLCDYNIPVRRPGRQKTTYVDRTWLHEQYIIHGRSLTGLAEEAGMTWATMARWAQRQDIPLRRVEGFRRRRNHPTAEDIAAAPPLLQPALIELGGAGRLTDFAATCRHRTLASAAEFFGIHPHTLGKRLRKLESDLGGMLYDRGGPGRPMKPTSLGHAVLDAIKVWTRTDPDQTAESTK